MVTLVLFLNDFYLSLIIAILTGSFKNALVLLTAVKFVLRLINFLTIVLKLFETVVPLLTCLFLKNSLKEITDLARTSLF